MAFTKPLFLETLESAHAVLTTLSAQDAPKIPEKIAPEALAHLSKQLWEHYIRMLGAVRESCSMIGETIETMKDLQLAKDPDVERLAKDIFVHSRAGGRTVQASECFTTAEGFIQFRNTRRDPAAHVAPVKK